MIDRLMIKETAGYDLKKMDGKWCGDYCKGQNPTNCNNCAIYEAIQKLGRYEDLERHDRLLIELPCSVGDTVYSFSSKKVYPFTVNGFHINKYDVEFTASYCGDEKSFENWTIRFSVLKFGKTVFLTREAAEQALDGKAGEQE